MDISQLIDANYSGSCHLPIGNAEMEVTVADLRKVQYLACRGKIAGLSLEECRIVDACISFVCQNAERKCKDNEPF